MSPKRADIESAIEGLKLEGSTPEMRTQARAKMSGRPAKILPKLALGGLPAVVAVALLWPHGPSGMAWGQALKNGVDAPRAHSVSRYRDGKISSEQWTEGNKQAWVLYGPDNEVFMEWRGDGERTLNYMHVQPLLRGPKNPNRRSFGEINRRKPGGESLHIEIGGSLEQLLRKCKYSVLKQTATKLNGEDVTEFHVQVTKPYPQDLIVVVKEKTGLICELRQGVDKFVQKIDYPDSIPPKTFDPYQPSMKNVEVYDRLDQIALIKKRVNAGLGTDKGVTLRLAVLDYTGAIWLVWTGLPVDGQMLHPFTVDGLKLGKPFGPRKLTSSADGKNDIPEFTKDNQRLYGMSREALTKVGSTIDVTIPTPKGAAHFKNVPVLRIGGAEGYSPWHHQSLGVEPFK